MPPKKRFPGGGGTGGKVLPGGGGSPGGPKKPAPKPPAKPTPQTPTPTPDPQVPDRTSAFAFLHQQLAEYGLSSLGSLLEGWIKDGITDASELELRLQGTQQWKTRFAGNEALRASGLPVLSVAEYLSVERSYAQVMKNYGLPSGFYDDPSDFAGFIGGSISASELQSRVQMYSDVAKREDPAIIAQLQSMGLSEGDILAHFMDKDRALPLLQRKYQQALLGGAARRAGVAADNDYLGKLADLGVTEREAVQGFGTVAEMAPTFTQLGAIHGDGYTAQDAQAEVFENDGNATRKRKRLASQERGAWSGRSGTDEKSFTRLTGGAY